MWCAFVSDLQSLLFAIANRYAEAATAARKVLELDPSRHPFIIGFEESDKLFPVPLLWPPIAAYEVFLHYSKGSRLWPPMAAYGCLWTL